MSGPRRVVFVSISIISVVMSGPATMTLLLATPQPKLLLQVPSRLGQVSGPSHPFDDVGSPVKLSIDIQNSI